MANLWTGSFWTTENLRIHGVEGGWIKYPQKPYRFVVNQRSSYGLDRHAKWLYGSHIRPQGYNYNDWDKTLLYHFPDHPGGDAWQYDITIGFDGHWDYTMVSTMHGTFAYCHRLGRNSSFKMNGCNLVNLTSEHNSGENMRYTFLQAFGYDIANEWTQTVRDNTTIELKYWNIAVTASDTTSGVYLHNMFNECTYFDGDVTGWTITDPYETHYMFNDCECFTGTGLSTWTIGSRERPGVLHNLNTSWGNAPNGIDHTISISGSTIDYQSFVHVGGTHNNEYNALEKYSYVTQSTEQNVDKISATIGNTTNGHELFYVGLAASSVYDTTTSIFTQDPNWEF